MVKNDVVKGFVDFTGEDALKREKMLDIIKSNFKKYGFEPAYTPIIESEEFVTGENSNDSAVRDVFKLKDRGKRNLALRYEFTFQLKRIANKQKLPYKRFQIGYNFRDEPIRKGRTRQFIQADADVIGSSVKDEAENFLLIKNVLSEFKIPFKIYVNNRKLLNEILVDENIEEKNREDVIREIDKLDKLPKKEVADNLKKYNAEKLLKVIDNEESFFEKYNYYSEIKELKKYCKMYNVEVEFRPFLARGFSYYNGMVFEVWSKDLGVSIMGGGSYIINEIQATGISFGIEPLFLLSKITGDPIEYLIISLNQDKDAINLSQKLREKEKSVQLLTDKTLKKALEYANSKNIQNIVVVGENEAKSKAFKVKNMKTGKEEKLIL